MMRIALELLQAEHEALLRDHYDTAQVWGEGCDGCSRAIEVRLEIEALAKLELVSG